MTVVMMMVLVVMMIVMAMMVMIVTIWSNLVKINGLLKQMSLITIIIITITTTTIIIIIITMTLIISLLTTQYDILVGSISAVVPRVADLLDVDTHVVQTLELIRWTQLQRTWMKENWDDAKEGCSSVMMMTMTTTMKIAVFQCSTIYNAGDDGKDDKKMMRLWSNRCDDDDRRRWQSRRWRRSLTSELIGAIQTLVQPVAHELLEDASLTGTLEVTRTAGCYTWRCWASCRRMWYVNVSAHSSNHFELKRNYCLKQIIIL